MSRFTKIFFIVFLLSSMLFIFFPESLEAQCRMCAAGAESNLKNGGTEGLGLNKGILYLLAMPYLVGSTIGILWWRNRKKQNLNTV